MPPAAFSPVDELADPFDDLLLDDPTQPEGWAWEDVSRLVDALEHAVGLQFRRGPTRPPNTTDTQLARLVERLDAEGYDAMWDWRRQWRMNEAFGRGEFGAHWHEGNREIEYDEIQPRVHVPIFNATCKILEARLNSTKPELVIAPRSTDQAAIDLARAANRAAQSQYQEIGVDDARREVTHKLVRKGSVFGKLTWDPKGGKYLGKTTIPKRGADGRPIPRMAPDDNLDSPTFGELMPVLDEDGVPEWEVETDEFGAPVEVDAYAGCNVLSIVDPENVIVDPTVTRWRDRRWTIHRYHESPAAIEERLGFTGIVPDSKWAAEQPNTSSARPGRTSRRSDAKTALVRELYIRRGTFPASDKDGDTISFPDGWIVVECQGQIKAEPNRYGDGPLWFAKAEVGDEQLHGECLANDIRGIQATYTRTMSDWDFQLQVTGNPRIFWPAAAGTPDEGKVGTPGAIVQVEGLRAEDRPYLLPGAVSPGVQQFASIIFNDILGYISGVREGGLGGGTPANIEAAAAFRVLIETDATRLATTVLGYGLFLQQLLERVVHNLKTFASDERLYAIVGPDLQVEVEEFSGADLDDDLACIVVPESIKPQSDAVKRAGALELYNLGLATRRDTVLRIGEMGDGQDALREQRLIQHCKREAKQALTEKVIYTPLQLMQYEDHALALDQHTADVFDQRFHDDPEAQAVLLLHMDLHAWFLGGMVPEMFPGDPALLAGFVPMVPPAAAPMTPTTQAGGSPVGMETGAPAPMAA